MNDTTDPHDVCYHYIDRFVWMALAAQIGLKHYNDHESMIMLSRTERSVRHQVNVVYNANLLI